MRVVWFRKNLQSRCSRTYCLSLKSGSCRRAGTLSVLSAAVSPVPNTQQASTHIYRMNE